ncbi:Nitrate reductase [NADH] NR [Rhizobium favelukesii]|uniref:Nitrate reductase [NADH] NR n=1 Tax=Rhizobium favelukesii TaxID=348824 RepID=W6RIQ0_9HYPH|nr:Nitrate reductase [NADH] NR [Rhizobium favelukesii]
MNLTLDAIKARPRQEVVFTVECSGNHGFPFFTGGIGNARWAGTPLGAILQEAGVLDNGIEVVFFGTDIGDVTIRDIKMPQHFARSMSRNPPPSANAPSESELGRQAEAIACSGAGLKSEVVSIPSAAIVE